MEILESLLFKAIDISSIIAIKNIIKDMIQIQKDHNIELKIKNLDFF